VAVVIIAAKSGPAASFPLLFHPGDVAEDDPDMHRVLLFHHSVNRETSATPHPHAENLSRCMRMVGELLTTAELIGRVDESRYFRGHFRVFCVASRLKRRTPNDVPVCAPVRIYCRAVARVMRKTDEEPTPSVRIIRTRRAAQLVHAPCNPHIRFTRVRDASRPSS
jgi:hypothetical protein